MIEALHFITKLHIFSIWKLVYIKATFNYLSVLIFDLYNCKFDEALVKQNWCSSGTYGVLVCSVVSKPFGSLVYWFGCPNSGSQKRFFNFLFSVVIQQRNMLKKSKWLRRQKINRRHQIERRDCLQKCFHSFK